MEWFSTTLKTYPEIAIFLALALGYFFGKFTFKGIGLGSVTATLLAGVLIGQIGITISQPLKATVFLMFLFAVGYAVGPQFVRGVAKDGLPQAIFAVVQCVFCLVVPVIIAKMAGYDLGYSAGLYSGSQTISAAMGLSTDAINRLGLPPEAMRQVMEERELAQIERLPKDKQAEARARLEERKKFFAELAQLSDEERRAKMEEAMEKLMNDSDRAARMTAEGVKRGAMKTASQRAERYRGYLDRKRATE